MGMRSIVWTAVHSVSPDLHLTLKSMLGARRSRETERRTGQLAATAAFIKSHGPAVLAGPFKGLKFPAASFGHNLVPKLTGAYEYQLHPFIETLIARQPRQVVDIGSAEGYYANGLALRLSASFVRAFDAAPGERAICKQVAAENELSERVMVGGICAAEWLRSHLRPGDLVFSDCEGGEDTLLDPSNVASLRSCDLLIETHDALAPSVTDRLVDRFRDTHEIHRVGTVLAPRETLPVLDSWTATEYEQALSENRSAEQEWLVLMTRSARSSS